MPIPVAARSATCVCSRSFVGIAGSNPTGDTDVCLLWVLCVVRWRFLWQADHSFRVVLQSVECLSVNPKPEKWGILGPPWPPRHKKHVFIAWWLIKHRDKCYITILEFRVTAENHEATVTVAGLLGCDESWDFPSTAQQSCPTNRYVRQSAYSLHCSFKSCFWELDRICKCCPQHKFACLRAPAGQVVCTMPTLRSSNWLHNVPTCHTQQSYTFCCYSAQHILPSVTFTQQAARGHHHTLKRLLHDTWGSPRH
jgi:hypothetical protein